MKHVPFTRLASRSTDYIEDRYVPYEFVWKDPRNMSKETILELCNHIRQRQDQYGAEEGFRFLSYYNGKEIVEAEYGRNAEEERAAAKSTKQKKKRKESERNQKSKTIRKANKRLPQSTLPGEVSDNDVGGYVDDIAMQKLIAQGYSNTIPVNGPDDGPPRYYVPAAALKLLSGNNSVESHSNSKELSRDHKVPSEVSNDESGRNIKETDKIDPKPRRSNRVQSVLKESKTTKKKSGVLGVDPTTKMQTRSQKKTRKASRK